MIRNLLLIFLFSGMVISAKAYTQRDILQKKSQSFDFSRSILSDNSWNDFPAYPDRSFWSSVPDELAKPYIVNAEKYLEYDWPSVKATDYLEFIRSGDRRQEVFGAPKTALLSLMMGELIEGKGRFIDQIVNGVWFYCEQSWWGWSAHLYLQKAPGGLPDANDRTIDLGVGDMANILSWAWHYFHEEFNKIHPLISPRLKSEIQKKAIQPYLERTDFWWMGIEDQSHINNWNPWVNYNMLNCILLIEDNPEKKIAGLQKIVRSLDVFLNSYPDDGGCNEGPSYWGAAGAQLFKSLEILQKLTAGRLDVFDHPLVQNMGTYIYKVYIHQPYFINFADADAQTNSSPFLIYRYGKAIADPVMQQFGAFLAQNSDWGKQPFGGTPDEQITNLMLRGELLNAEAAEALVGSFWLPDTEVGGARDKEDSSRGFFFAAKGGFNAESHNHNDAGSCVLYYDGKPVLIDVGRETYTAKTFGRNRYDIWTMQSQYHNLPKINGADQSPGKEFKAVNTSFANTASKTVFTTNIAPAYPEEAKVDKWERTYTLQKGKSFEIIDNYQLREQTGLGTSLNLMTCCSVASEKPGLLILKNEGGSFKLEYNPVQLEPLVEHIPVADNKLKRYWPDGLARIVFQVKGSGAKGKIVTRISKI
ncbi:MAG: heparinase II/III family protein [Prolixibacteraceae bacterium]|jgi:hypothetical protein|nr:heparinase II/III family protein [Prolixibacteraceae bacterium]